MGSEIGETVDGVGLEDSPKAPQGRPLYLTTLFGHACASLTSTIYVNQWVV